MADPRPCASPHGTPVFFRDPNATRPYHAGVSSDRTNLSPFTKDYRGLALQCDLAVFRALRGAHQKKTKKNIFTMRTLTFNFFALKMLLYKFYPKCNREQPESNRRPQDLQSYALPLSYTPETTSAGFEPTRAEPSRFRVYRLNHSAKMPMDSCTRAPSARRWPTRARARPLMERQYFSGIPTLPDRTTQGSVQIELIFRLLLKITVDWPSNAI